VERPYAEPSPCTPADTGAGGTLTGLASMAIGDLPHQPVRPDWHCEACALPWPCETARQQLAADLDPIALAMNAWAHLELAAEDLTDISPTDLFTRFLAWTRRP
jgi:hypothetical protein